MIIGHVGVAYAARARWTRIPFALLVAATMAPDLLRLGLMPLGLGFQRLNLYSHAFPWSVALAAGAGAVVWAIWRDRVWALVIAAVVLSHIALDVISGRKPLWIGGPTGLDLQRFQQLEFAIEGLLLFVGWRTLRRRAPHRAITRRVVLAALLAGHAVYLATTLMERPYATRCIEYPIQPCWKRRHDRPPN